MRQNKSTENKVKKAIATLNSVTDNPKIMSKTLSDGRESLYLLYYFGCKREKVIDADGNEKVHVIHDRKKVSLELYMYGNPKTAEQRIENKNTFETAKEIKQGKVREFLKDRNGYRVKIDTRSINFLSVFESYIETYTKKDVKMIQMAYRNFVSFLSETPKYHLYSKSISPNRIDKDLVSEFAEYLKSTHKGEGAQTVFHRFKKVIKYMVEKSIMATNPCTEISISCDNDSLRKEILSATEIERLIATHYSGENTNIRNAFIISLYCGMRWCDVKDLTYKNIDYSNKLLRFEQNKTKNKSKYSQVTIPLNDDLLKVLGTPSDGDKDSLIFKLPSHTMCLKALRHWTKRAGIDKHITWHCARHSFAVNILNNGANIKTVASLLGHSGLQHTDKYTRAVDDLKKQAIDSLPKINL